MKSGIYEIRNKINGKRYVGSASNLDNRFYQHFGRLRKGIHPNKYLQSSWNKYGELNFIFSVLLICSKEHLLMYEQRAIDVFDSFHGGYNLDPRAGSRIGTKASLKLRKKLSKIQKRFWINFRKTKSFIERNTKISKSMKKLCLDRDVKERMSLASRSNWKNPVYRNSVVSQIRERCKNRDFRQLRSLNSKKMWKNPGIRRKIIQARKKVA